jgi:hypothetical protein
MGFELDQRAMQAGLKCDRIGAKRMNDQRVPAYIDTGLAEIRPFLQ